MIIIRNPAHSRPLSQNVKRLMKESRASPYNPAVVKAGRTMADKDLAFCDLQGNIFMAAVDRGLDMELFKKKIRDTVSGTIEPEFLVFTKEEEDVTVSYTQG